VSIVSKIVVVYSKESYLERPILEQPTFINLQRIVDDGIQEGLRLEFKPANIIENSNTGIIAKAVTAFANSDGGILIIGITANKDTKSKTTGASLVGLKNSKDKTEWLETIIENNTYPSVWDYQVFPIENHNAERFYWISIARSKSAPHQSEDKIYYKRNGSNSIPMEHFEIEDVRSRSLVLDTPLDISVDIDQGVFTELRIANNGNKPISECRFEFITNLALNEKTKSRLEDRGLNFLHGKQEAVFFLGPLRDFLAEARATLRIKFQYKLGEKKVSDARDFDFHDFDHQSIIHSPHEKILEKIERSIVRLGDKVESLDKHMKTISQAFSSSGLHLSDSSLEVFKNPKASKLRKYRIAKADVEGIRDILKVDAEQAREICRFFAYFGGMEGWQNYFESLSPELRELINQRMEIER
jgi:Putative DNA-binding domain